MALCCRNGGSIYPGRVALCCRTDGSTEPGIFNIVPGNHDINRECKERNDAIDRFYNTSNRKNSYYRSDVGEIKDEDLMAIGLSKADFNGIVSTVYDGNLDRISLYTNPLKPHFLIKESDLNIVHLDSTISYSSHQQNNLIIGTLPLMEVLPGYCRI